MLPKYNPLTKALASTRAAIDLASIMVGVIVIGIIGGIIAAVIFAVIPWSQDNAAKAELDSVATAQSAYRGLSDDNIYGDYAQLQQAKLLGASPTVTATPGTDGTCYLAQSTSATGKVFYNTSKTPEPKLYESDAVSDCEGTEIIPPAGTPIDAETPAPVSMTGLGCESGYTNAICITKEGKLYGAGLNARGELANGTTTARNTYSAILPDRTFKRVVINNINQTNTATATVFALDNEGNLFGWGGNSYNVFGTHISAGAAVTSPVALSAGTQFNEIFGSGQTLFAIDKEGNLWGQGENGYKQVGSAPVPDLRVANLTPVPTPENVKYVQVAPGFSSTMALDTNGDIWYWGLNTFFDAIDPNVRITSPRKLDTSMKFSSIGNGNQAHAAIDVNGKLWTWGRGSNGSLGHGPTTTVSAPTPVMVMPDKTWKKVTLSGTESYAIDSDDKIWSWGYNYYGQLGLGDTVTRGTPTQVSDISFDDITIGGYSVLATAIDGTYWAWGRNHQGQLGTGDAVDRNALTQITLQQ